MNINEDSFRRVNMDSPTLNKCIAQVKEFMMSPCDILTQKITLELGLLDMLTTKGPGNSRTLLISYRDDWRFMIVNFHSMEDGDNGFMMIGAKGQPEIFSCLIIGMMKHMGMNPVEYGEFPTNPTNN